MTKIVKNTKIECEIIKGKWVFKLCSNCPKKTVKFTKISKSVLTTL